MNVNVSYLGRSHLRQSSGGQRILDLAPNLSRDKVALDAALKEPTRFREAISTLHDVVVNDLTFKPRDKSASEEWKKQQTSREHAIRIAAMQSVRETVVAGRRRCTHQGRVGRRQAGLERGGCCGHVGGFG